MLTGYPGGLHSPSIRALLTRPSSEDPDAGGDLGLVQRPAHGLHTNPTQQSSDF